LDYTPAVSIFNPSLRPNFSLPKIPYFLPYIYSLISREKGGQEMAAQSKEVLSPWGSALAGALGAVFANTCVYPLDM